MEIINASAEPKEVLYSWLPQGLDAEKIVFLPDACPGKSPLPTGTAVFTKQPEWQRFAVSDCGCGMRLLKSNLTIGDMTTTLWDDIANRIKANKGGLGDLGGGNHFLDALLPYDEDSIYFLIHTGSRLESNQVDDFVDKPALFEKELNKVVDWAEANRAGVQKTLEKVVGEMELVLDLPHNTVEVLAEGVIIRKGSVRLMPGELAVIPSHMTGDVALVQATERIREVLNSMSHGTGRIMSRGDAKEKAAGFDFAAMRESLLLPSFLGDASLTTEAPYAYRDLESCLALVSDYVEEVKRFSVVAYAGHL